MPAGLTPLSGLQAGERAPDALLVVEPRKRLYDVFRHPGFTILAITGAGQDETDTIAAAVRMRKLVEQRHRGRARCHLVTDNTEAGFDVDNRTADETGELAERYAVGEQSRFVVVRPDLYVAMVCALEEADAVADYLDQWFVPATDSALV